MDSVPMPVGSSYSVLPVGDESGATWDFFFDNCIRSSGEHPNEIDTIPCDDNGPQDMVTRTFHWKPEDFPLEMATYMQCDAPWDGKGFKTGKGMSHKLQPLPADDYDGGDMLDEEEDIEAERRLFRQLSPRPAARIQSRGAAGAEPPFDPSSPPSTSQSCTQDGWAEFTGAPPASAPAPAAPVRTAASRTGMQPCSAVSSPLDFNPGARELETLVKALPCMADEDFDPSRGLKAARALCVGDEDPIDMGSLVLEAEPAPEPATAPAAPASPAAEAAAPAPVVVVSELEALLKAQTAEIQRLREALAMASGANMCDDDSIGRLL